MPATIAVAEGISKIKHVVVIMQENRSFDTYFGTYPGADGIPAADGAFTVCVPNPTTHTCDAPYHNPALASIELSSPSLLCSRCRRGWRRVLQNGGSSPMP